MDRNRKIGVAVFAVALAAVALLSLAVARVRTGVVGDAIALIGEARTGGLTLMLPEAVRGVRVREARVPGRPIVLIDPGHGGRDPGASGISGASKEKDLTLAMGRELADLLEQRGRVRVALTREDDKYLTLEQRAAVARHLRAGLFLEAHYMLALAKGTELILGPSQLRRTFRGLLAQKVDGGARRTLLRLLASANVSRRDRVRDCAREYGVGVAVGYLDNARVTVEPINSNRVAKANERVVEGHDGKFDALLFGGHRR